MDSEINVSFADSTLDRGLTRDVLELGARLGNDVVVENPTTLNLAASLLDAKEKFLVAGAECHTLLLRRDLSTEHMPLLIVRLSIEVDSVALLSHTWPLLLDRTE